MTTKDPITKQADGTFSFRVSLGTDKRTGKRIQKRASGFKTKTEAKKARLALLAAGVEPDEDIKKTRFGEFMEDVFKPWYKTQVKPRTYRQRLALMNSEYLTRYNDIIIDQIRPIDVQHWQVSLLKDCQQSYARTINIMLGQVLERAKALGIISENPVRVVGLIKKKKAKIHFWTQADFQKVLAKTNTDTYTGCFDYTVLWFMFMSGLRSGEARALKWTDVDLEAKTVNINKTMDYHNRNWFETPAPKTAASRRTVALDDNTVVCLRAWQIAQAAMVHSDWVFSRDGIPSSDRQFIHIVNTYSEAAKVQRITVHGLRHSHVSLLISLGENPLQIKERLGHEDIETTLGTYGHLYPNSNFEVAKKLNGIFSKEVPDELK
ncbi:tyrosine-type recombinase/integrase [Agrilactobacillus yilanensis]|uniref:Tyrosine-type recombinase/integrase n=1 Tax=Agrilactobacillus yilanensis TaxID=2485997 RepID=A0ABW4J5Z2_9LACO|nr:tyrosine-type recombinase/integrase [Agrilactobacillus yilanensis]